MKTGPRPNMKPKFATAETIYETADYDLIERAELQRKVRQGNLKKVRRSMQKYGFRKSCPISVYWKNGKLHINNGHHRFFVAMQLGLKIYFVIEAEWEWDAMKDEGLSGEKWKGEDIIHGEVIQGNEDYKVLRKYALKGIPTSVAASMLHGETAGSGNAGVKVTDGTFKVNTTELIDKFVEFLDEFGKTCPVVTTRFFQLALGLLLRVPDFDADRMKQKLRANGGVLVPVQSRDQALAQLEEIYNYRVTSSAKVPLHFLAKKRAEEANFIKAGKK